MSGDQSYFLAANENNAELRRLQAIERSLDPLSQQLLLDAGLATGAHCLEVGAGAGSMLRWLGAQVGSTGKVTAIDLDTKYVRDIDTPNVEVIAGDIRQLALPADHFDFIHCRNVLTHIFEWAAVCRALVAALKPGGCLVIEEPDFAVARWVVASPRYRDVFANFFAAFAKFSAMVGMQFDFGRRVPAILQVNGLANIRVVNDEPILRGGSEEIQMIRESSTQLAPMFQAKGLLSAEDAQTFIEFIEDSANWGIHMATVRGVGFKPA